MTRFLVPIVALVLSLHAHADPVSNAEELFYSWDPTSIELRSDGTLAVFLPQRRITATIYYASIRSGFCMASIRDMDMSGVRSVLIGNQSKTQGWFLEAGTEICEDSSELNIAAHTHVVTDTANGI